MKQSPASYAAAAGSQYRYGFNGKELDSDFNNNYDYGFRIYNPSIAKFLSVDPLALEYPFYTPYQFAGNTPIVALDIDGLEPVSFQEFLDFFGWGNPLEQKHSDKIEQEADYQNTISDRRAGMAQIGQNIEKTYEKQREIFTWVPGMEQVYEAVDVHMGRTTPQEASLNIGTGLVIDYFGGKLFRGVFNSKIADDVKSKLIYTFKSKLTTSDVSANSKTIVGTFEHFNGVLSADLLVPERIKKVDDKMRIGKDMFNDAFEYFDKKMGGVTAIKGLWVESDSYANGVSDNLAKYREGIMKGLSKEQAAMETWTGQRAKDRGFTGPPLVNDSDPNRIQILFTK